MTNIEFSKQFSHLLMSITKPFSSPSFFFFFMFYSPLKEFFFFAALISFPLWQKLLSISVLMQSNIKFHAKKNESSFFFVCVWCTSSFSSIRSLSFPSWEPNEMQKMKTKETSGVISSDLYDELLKILSSGDGIYSLSRTYDNGGGYRVRSIQNPITQMSEKRIVVSMLSYVLESLQILNIYLKWKIFRNCWRSWKS